MTILGGDGTRDNVIAAVKDLSDRLKAIDGLEDLHPADATPEQLRRMFGRMRERLVDLGQDGIIQISDGLETADLRGPIGLASGEVDDSEDGGGSYHADAVHFDGSSWLDTEALAATDNAFFSFSFWINPPTEIKTNNVIWVVDPEDTYRSADDFGTFLNGDDEAVFDYYFECGLLDGSQFLKVQMITNNVLVSSGWVHLCGSLRTDTGTGLLFVNDVENSQISHAGTFASCAFSGLPFYVGSDTFEGDGLLGDLADVWLAPGVLVDFSVEANRRIFISADGKPVNPSGFPASAVLFSGNASTFPVNQGTGGAFTLTGSLTNASTSPSD